MSDSYSERGKGETEVISNQVGKQNMHKMDTAMAGYLFAFPAACLAAAPKSPFPKEESVINNSVSHLGAGV